MFEQNNKFAVITVSQHISRIQILQQNANVDCIKAVAYKHASFSALILLLCIIIQTLIYHLLCSSVESICYIRYRRYILYIPYIHYGHLYNGYFLTFFCSCCFLAYGPYVYGITSNNKLRVFFFFKYNGYFHLLEVLFVARPFAAVGFTPFCTRPFYLASYFVAVLLALVTLVTPLGWFALVVLSCRGTTKDTESNLLF